MTMTAMTEVLPGFDFLTILLPSCYPPNPPLGVSPELLLVSVSQ